MAKRRIKTVQKRNVGRPEHKPDRKTRQLVENGVTAGMTHQDIARAIGISWKTLDKYYAEELATGVARKRLEAISMLYRSAKGGNVSAQRKFYAIAHGEDVSSSSVDEDTFDKPKKLGKKEQVQRDAENISDKYAPPEPPKLIVNNTK